MPESTERNQQDHWVRACGSIELPSCRPVQRLGFGAVAHSNSDFEQRIWSSLASSSIRNRGTFRPHHAVCISVCPGVVTLAPYFVQGFEGSAVYKFRSGYYISSSASSRPRGARRGYVVLALLSVDAELSLESGYEFRPAAALKTCRFQQLREQASRSDLLLRPR